MDVITCKAMLTALIALTLAAQEPVVVDFDGMALSVPAAPRDRQIKGAAQSWTGRCEMELKDKKENMANYAVTVTDISALSPTPTEDEVFVSNEQRMRKNALMSGQNFRKTLAKLGSHKLLILNGSLIAKNSNQQAVNAFWVSCVFTAGKKVYEFSQVSMLDSLYATSLRNIGALALSEGETTSTVTGLPADLKGDYTVSGIPFILKSDSTPVALPNAALNGNFLDGYSASVAPIIGPSYTYKARRLRPGEDREDTALFRSLLVGAFPLEEIPESKFEVEDRSATVEVTFKRNGHEQMARLRFEHIGDWISVLIGILPELSTDGVGFGGCELKRGRMGL